MNATKLRQRLYAILDEILETGIPVEVERHGRTLRIVPTEAPSKLSRLEKHTLIQGDPDEIVHQDWSSDWTGRDDL